jgi:hypothetical protein
MAESISTIASLPSPKRLIGALRDVGYDFAGAVADIVDNSLAADATEIDIQLHWDGPDSWIRIADNGFGMDPATISEALRFGSERSYRPDDLGKFGLGLKTASLSQCKDITVASRTSDKICRLEVRRFDLDRVFEKNKWEIEDLPARFRVPELVEPLQDAPGTVVLWTKLDRVLSYRSPHGDRAKNAFWDMAERLEQHLGMVFHRFIEGDLGTKRRKRVVIRVNGNKIASWNPFALEEKDTKHLQRLEVDVAENGVAGFITFDPYVLPSKDRFSSEAEFNRLSGPSKWNQQQGLYIYRANRMIQSGGWSRLRTADEHTKLARVALDFFPDLDEAFGLNIAKMRVNLPGSLRERIKTPIEDLLREAKKAYNPKSTIPKPKVKTPTTGLPLAGNLTPAEKPTAVGLGGGTGTSVDAPVGVIPWPPPVLKRAVVPRPALERAAASVGEADALERIIMRLRSDSPEVCRDLGWQ